MTASPFFIKLGPGMSINATQIALVQDEGSHRLTVGLCTPGPDGSTAVRVDDPVAVAALRRYVANHTKPARLSELMEDAAACAADAPRGAAHGDGSSSASN